MTDVGPTYVSLMWSSIEEGPVWYSVYRDGTPILVGDRRTSAIIPLLRPETSYTFTVLAGDFGGNRSPLSDPVTAVTEAVNPDDHTPPSTPANFYGANWGREVELNWDESTDDLDPQWVIVYEIYVNDVYDHSLSLRYHKTIVYGAFDGLNTFSVVAVDTAGNKSEAATFSLPLEGCVAPQ